MEVYQLSPLLTTCLAAVSLTVGYLLVNKIKFLKKCSIPSPVIGGLIFSIIHLILHECNVVELAFDDTIKNFFMTIFFASVGLSTSFKTLKKGGLDVLKLIGFTAAIIIIQNFVSLSIASGGFNWNYNLSLATGSIPLVGGHGTVASFGPLLEKRGGVGAEAVASTCATFGLIIGSLIGAPLGAYLIKRKKTLTPAEQINNIESKKTDVRKIPKTTFDSKSFGLNKENELPDRLMRLSIMVVILLICSGVGELINYAIGLIRVRGEPLVFPSYIGALVLAIIVRNVADFVKHPIPLEENKTIGHVSLLIFLGIALVSIKLWELKGLGLVIALIVFLQAAIVFITARYVIFNLMGRNYDASIYAAAFCGYALGATPNAIANMQTLTERYGDSPNTSLVVPIVSTIFADLFNTAIILIFLNICPLIFG